MACTDTERRCQAGLVPVAGSAPLRCVAPLDATSPLDAGSTEAGAGDAGDAGEAGAADVPVDACVANDPLGDFIDQNCDGIDGVGGGTAQLYVAPTGSDQNPGTDPTRPFGSVAHALSVANGRPILVQTGTYVAPVVMNMNGGLDRAWYVLDGAASVYGGYSASWGRAAAPARSSLRGVIAAVIVRDNRNPITLANLDLVAEALPTGMGPPRAVSHYGLVGINTGRVRLQGVNIQVAAGIAGAQGAEGQSQTTAAGAGGQGQNLAGGAGGAPGQGCPGASANGGQGGQAAVAAGMPTPGENGQPGSTTVAAVPGQSGIVGTTGRDGAASMGGLYTVDGFAPGDGLPGAQGGAGGGGGGGVAGAVGAPGAGGGGGGGCGGHGGAGGGGGSGAFGVFLLGCAAQLEMPDGSITVGNGGAGAGGGRPGNPQPGGSAGPGGVSGSFTGNVGGAGGGGGAGGVGGNGAGGPSVGILLTAGATFVDLMNNTVRITVGQGGAAGTGGMGLAAQGRAESVLTVSATAGASTPLPTCGDAGVGDAGR